MNRCELCPKVGNCVPGDGPKQTDIMFVGDAPGKMECDRKRLFVGKAGMEFNEHYLPLANLHRTSVYVTNAIKCLPPSVGGKLDADKSADIDLLNCCASTHLYEEIESVRPRIIVPLGAFACRIIDPDINLELQHGIPLQTAWGTVFPMYHPAGGMHEPKKMLNIRNDWVRLRKYLSGGLFVPTDPYPVPDYRHIGIKDLPGVLESVRPYTPIAIDTEILRTRKAFCLTFSMRPGTGYMILVSDTGTLKAFQTILDHSLGPILFHNYYFDGPVVESMGIRIPFHRVVDTMVRAYLLGNIPQGLKALSYRLLGMRMQDFDDLVTPYAVPHCLDYINQAYHEDWPMPMEDLVRNKDGILRLYKPQSMNTKLKRFLTDYSKNPNKDVFESWKNWKDSHKLIQERLGPWPGKCISYVPFEKVIYYACRDADATIRLWPILEYMRRRIRKRGQEYWELEAA